MLDGRIFNQKGRQLIPQLNPNGYLGINLMSGGKRKKFLIHRLIAQKFIPNPNNKPCINHKNGIKTDNRIENLEWVTYKENTHHRDEIIEKGAKGENVGTAKIKNSEAEQILISYQNGRSICKLAKDYKVSTTCIWHIVTGKTFKKSYEKIKLLNFE